MLTLPCLHVFRARALFPPPRLSIALVSLEQRAPRQARCPSRASRRLVGAARPWWEPGSRLSKKHARLAWPMSCRAGARSRRLGLPRALQWECAASALRKFLSVFHPCVRMLRPSYYLEILRWLVIIFLFARGNARQQCRLVQKLDVQSGGDHPQFPLSGNPTSTQDSSSQPSQTASAAPSITPFNYGHDVIRGVNL